MPTRSPLQAGESKKDRAQQKYRIWKRNKRRESTIKDQAHCIVLHRVLIQRMSTHTVESSGAHNAAL